MHSARETPKNNRPPADHSSTMAELGSLLNARTPVPKRVTESTSVAIAAIGPSVARG
jgi:hypothetical protein